MNSLSRRNLIGTSIAASFLALSPFLLNTALASENDFDFLDELSIDELESLKDAIDSEIESRKDDSSSNQDEGDSEYDKPPIEWTKDYQSDREPFLGAIAAGTYSNLKTIDGQCLVKLLVVPFGDYEDPQIYFVLTEGFGNSPYIFESSTDFEDYILTVIDQQGDEHKIPACTPGTPFIVAYEHGSLDPYAGARELYAILCQEGPIQFTINKIGGDGFTEASFSIINPDDFEEKYSDVYEEYDAAWSLD